MLVDKVVDFSVAQVVRVSQVQVVKMTFVIPQLLPVEISLCARTSGRSRSPRPLGVWAMQRVALMKTVEAPQLPFIDEVAAYRRDELTGRFVLGRVHSHTAGGRVHRDTAPRIWCMHCSVRRNIRVKSSVRTIHQPPPTPPPPASSSPRSRYFQGSFGGPGWPGRKKDLNLNPLLTFSKVMYNFGTHPGRFLVPTVLKQERQSPTCVQSVFMVSDLVLLSLFCPASVSVSVGLSVSVCLPKFPSA